MKLGSPARTGGQDLLPPLGVLLEEVVLPALAAAGDQEPVVVEPDLVTAHLVLAVALAGGSRTRVSGELSAPLEKLVDLLKRISNAMVKIGVETQGIILQCY